MTSYQGKLLRVDLTHRTTHVEELEEGFLRLYLGGRGIAAYYLLRELEPAADPLGPENKLIFACGPATGLPLPGAGRHGMAAKSPLTGAFGEAESGGFFGTELKQAGYDVVIFEGAASSPVYLWIKDGAAEIRDAQPLWGMDPVAAQDAIQGEVGDRLVRVAQIGRAGENRVRYASIMNDLVHGGSRTGLGAVMGAKKLKAVAVRGSVRIKSADPETVTRLGKRVRENPGEGESLARYGTAGVVLGHGKKGNLPVRNFQDGFFEGVEKIDGQALVDQYRTEGRGCYACFIRCDPVTAGETKWGAVDSKYGGPEYETIAALGSNCGVDDLGAIVKGNELCNRYGMDTISAGASIAFAMECFERGLIDQADTGGIELRFGNADAMICLIDQIAARQGFGAVLSEGVKRASEIIGQGSEAYALHVKGMEVPMHEPRFKKGLGLGMATNPAGPDHACSVHDTSISSEAGIQAWKGLGIQVPLPPTELSDRKVSAIYKAGLVRHLSNNLLMCTFVPYGIEGYCEVVNAATGWNMTVYELLKVAERSLTLAHIFNLREGFTPADDVLPKRFATSQRGGPLEGQTVDPEDLDEAKRLLYGMWGWDPETSVPTRARLVELEIDWAMQEKTRRR